MHSFQESAALGLGGEALTGVQAVAPVEPVVMSNLSHCSAIPSLSSLVHLISVFPGHLISICSDLFQSIRSRHELSGGPTTKIDTPQLEYVPQRFSSLFPFVLLHYLNPASRSMVRVTPYPQHRVWIRCSYPGGKLCWCLEWTHDQLS